MNRLSPEARALIDAAARQENLPSEKALGRVRQSVVGRAAAMGAASASASSALGAKTGVLGAGAAIKLISFVVAGAVTGGAAIIAASPSFIGRTTQPIATGHVGASSTGAPALVSAAPAIAGTGQGSPTTPIALPIPEPIDLPRAAPIALSRAARPDGPSVDEMPATVAKAKSAADSSAPARKVIATSHDEPPPGRPDSTAPQGAELTRADPTIVTVAETAPGNLARELSTLREARRALGAGKAGDVLEMLDEAERIFRGAPLEEEFRTAHIAALCQLGRSEQAQFEISALTARWPNSPAARRLSTGCAVRHDGGPR